MLKKRFHSRQANCFVAFIQSAVTTYGVMLELNEIWSGSVFRMEMKYTQSLRSMTQTHARL